MDTNTTPMLLRVVPEGRLDVYKVRQPPLALEGMLAVYDTFGGAEETKALKVIIERCHHLMPSCRS